MLDVDAIQARLDKLVPVGPWKVWEHEGTTTVNDTAGVYVAHIGNTTWPGVAEMAAFIANSPADIGDLLQERHRLLSRIAYLESWKEQAEQGMDGEATHG